VIWGIWYLKEKEKKNENLNTALNAIPGGSSDTQDYLSCFTNGYPQSPFYHCSTISQYTDLNYKRMETDKSSNTYFSLVTYGNYGYRWFFPRD
jgi:hypothetical protein